MIPNSRAAQEWLGSLPRTAEFSLDKAYQQFLSTFPRQAPDRAHCSRLIIRSKLFERWKDDDGTIMFRYRRELA